MTACVSIRGGLRARVVTLWGCLPVLLVLGACSGLPLAAPGARSDAAFGEAVRQARARQVIHPQAAHGAGAVAGIDAQAGRSVIEAYQKSFQEPPRSFNILGIGGTAIGSGP